MPCPRCKKAFDCKAADIEQCACTSLTLSAAALPLIAGYGKQCLCLNCLTYLNKHAMDIQERIEKSTSRIFKAVFPNTTNHYDTLFGGKALQLMDEVAFICATRFARKRMVTVSSDRVDFDHPIPAGTLIELVAKVVKVGNKSLQIQVDIFIEQMYEESREKAICGMFTFVAIDENKRPIPVLD